MRKPPRHRVRPLANAVRQFVTASWLAAGDHFFGGIMAGFIGALITFAWVLS
ncbi:hypothetical protein [Zavarzinia aquatilis]|uniref:hypothetical protein n=1 Tax=Zavarzinia aquatilis TaxID=2211142 RepID=UPI0014037CCA|nr:hypothetical protein [Zavarzinia aquatilis]